MPRLVILSVAAGAGHVRAGEALAEAARERGWIVDHQDALADAPRWFVRAYIDGYLALIERSPALWGCLFRSTDDADPQARGQRLRRWFEEHCLNRLVRRLEEDPPDAVICTHFLPAQVLAARQATGRWPCPTWVSVTDYGVHALWRHPGLRYAVADAASAWNVREHLPQVPVEVTGIPISRAFRNPPERTAARQRLGLAPAGPVLLLLGGGLGIGDLDQLAARLLALPQKPQVVVMSGRNEALRDRLLALPGDGRLEIVPYTKEPEVPMAAADLAIGKSGGLTTAECLALGLPLLAASPLPGQEERNASHLLEHGAGLLAFDAAGVLGRVSGLLDDPRRLETLADNARRLGRPRAADDLLDALAADLP